MKTLSSLLALALAIFCIPVLAADKSKSATPRISKERAQESALQAVPGELLHWDLQVADGSPGYAFYIKSKDGRINEVEIDANSGKKTHVGIEIRSGRPGRKEATTTNGADMARQKEARLTREQAQQKALRAYPGGVEYWELLVWETGGAGTLVYEFRIAGKSGKRVVSVNSKTGAVLSTSIFVDGSRL